MDKGIRIIGLIALVVVVFLFVRSTDDEKEEGPLPMPGVRQESIQCPACSGYRMIRGKRPMTMRICQFCSGKGGKILRIPQGHVRCPTCGGIGKKPPSSFVS